mgnify:CR=1 FL=1
MLEPVRHVGRMGYADLLEVDGQKERFTRNLAQFVAGRPANNVLLTGATGVLGAHVLKELLATTDADVDLHLQVLAGAVAALVG